MNTIKQAYTATADELTKRILVLIPAHPEIMTLGSPFDLFKINGFKCDDLGPSLTQAKWALGKARKLHKNQVTRILDT
jgi:hypothetical protein